MEAVLPSHRLTYLLVRLGLALFALGVVGAVSAGFEGRIEAELVRGNETTALNYIVGANQMRITVTGADVPHPIDIVDLKSGDLLIVFPHNQTYLRLKAGSESAPQGLRRPSPMPSMPTPASGLPPGIGPQGPLGPQGVKLPPRPSLAMLEPKPELVTTDEKKDILGFPCVRYELKRRGETLEVWATDKLLPFQGYVRNQSPRFGPRMIDEEWTAILKERKLFPLVASLHYDNGPERLRFEIKAVKKEKIADPDGKLFEPPEGYTEIQPLPN